MNKDQLYQRIVAILGETFAIDAERIKPESRLGEDLDIDSIDAVDLIVQLKPLIGSALRPEAFKTVRTIADVVDVAHAALHGATVDAVAAPGLDTPHAARV
jgi:acyl carrier protein